MCIRDSVNYGYKDCYIAKWNTAGGPLWTVQFGSNQDDVCWGVATDSTGAYVSGTSLSLIHICIANESGELILTEVALHLPAHASGAKGQPGHLDSGFSESHPIGGGLFLRAKRKASKAGERARGEPGFQKSTSGARSHFCFPPMRESYHEREPLS